MEIAAHAGDLGEKPQIEDLIGSTRFDVHERAHITVDDTIHFLARVRTQARRGADLLWRQPEMGTAGPIEGGGDHTRAVSLAEDIDLDSVAA